MNEEDYPALWRAADRLAAQAQRRYYALVRWQLLILSLISLLAAWSPPAGSWDRAISGAIAALMLAGFVLGVILRLRKPDDEWFAARALAENAKSAAWHFMIVAPSTKSGERCRADFLKTIQQIRKRFPQVDRKLLLEPGWTPITSRMSDTRDLALPERIAFYRRYRVEEQQDWYRQKAQYNSKLEGRWSAGILTVEAVAVLAAGLRTLLAWPFNPTGALAAAATALLAWAQARRFSDLNCAYSVASNDLLDIAERAKDIETEKDLRALVIAAEAAISREHRLWVERRASA
jgi:hypothetical protein